MRTTARHASALGAPDHWGRCRTCWMRIRTFRNPLPPHSLLLVQHDRDGLRCEGSFARVDGGRRA